MKKIIIIGAGGFGREVAWLIERINKLEPSWNIVGFIDDAPEHQGRSIGGYHVLGGCDIASHYQDAWFVCAIGSAQARKEVVKRIIKYTNNQIKFATLVDPSVIISERVAFGEGCIICAGSIITVDIKLGSHAIVNLDCTIGHDSQIGDFVTLYPSVNISGSTVVGECAELGTGMQTRQGIRIGENAIIGAGAVIVSNIPRSCTAVGVPAKVVKTNESEG